MRQWLDDCDSNHRLRCAQTHNTPLPRRVVDLGPPSAMNPPILLETDGDCGQYIALSYCWGTLPQVQTTKNHLRQFTESIDESRLSQTIRDAFILTRRLGLRYIWVDALCILQDDSDDFNIEALKMSQYYSKAYLTIAAGFAAGCQDGLLARPQVNKNEVELSYSRPENFGTKTVEYGSVFVCLGDRIQSMRVERKDALERRGWALQEKALSRRMLLFGSMQMSFICLDKISNEDGTVSPSFARPTKRHAIPMSLEVIGSNQNHLQRTKYAFYRWYTYLEEYSLREIGQSADKFTAIAAIAQSVQECTQSRYFFGIWEDDIARGLAWRSAQHLVSLNVHLPLTKLENGVPSWSWAAYKGRIFHRTKLFAGPEKDRPSYGWEPHNIRVRLSSGQKLSRSFDPIRLEHMGSHNIELRLEGTIKRLEISALTSMEHFLELKERVGSVAATQIMSSRISTSIVLQRKWTNADGVPQDEGYAGTWSDVAAIGALDMALAYDETSFWCMRLNKQEGLLICPVDGGRYRRVGIFSVADYAWFEQGTPEEIILV